MHVDHVLRSGTFVQIVDILGDEQHLIPPRGLKRGQGGMRGIGPRPGGIGAAQVVELMHQRGVAGEGVGGGDILDPVAFPQSAGVAEGPQPAFGGNSGTRQYYDLFHCRLLP